MKKKLIIVVTSLITMLVILGGCGNEKKKQAAQDDGLLKPGTVWKDEVGGKWHKIKIIDETTWEYSDEMNPDPTQITVEKQKDYEDLEKFKIIDSDGIDLFIGKTALIVPYEKDGMKVFKFIPTDDKEDRSKNEILRKYSTQSGYKLQKTSE